MAAQKKMEILRSEGNKRVLDLDLFVPSEHVVVIGGKEHRVEPMSAELYARSQKLKILTSAKTDPIYSSPNYETYVAAVGKKEAVDIITFAEKRYEFDMAENAATEELLTVAVPGLAKLRMGFFQMAAVSAFIMSALQDEVKESSVIAETLGPAIREMMGLPETGEGGQGDQGEAEGNQAEV